MSSELFNFKKLKVYKKLLRRIILFGLIIIIFNLQTPNSELIYAQDDYLEVKGDAIVDTLTFTGGNWTFPSTPVRGEVCYNSTDNRPYYFDGNEWILSGAGGPDRYLATIIVAAQDSLDTNRADRDFICNGSDDQDTINNAINALPAGGGVVYLLEGTYNISGSISFTIGDSNKSLIGAGAGTVLRTASDVNVIYAENVNRILISQMMIDGSDQAADYSSGIWWSSAVTNSKIDKLWIQDMGSYGIVLGGSCSNNTISNNSIDGTGNDCIAMGGSSSGYAYDNIISHNNVRSSHSDGIALTSYSANNIVSGNVASSSYNGNGIVLYGQSTICNIVYGNDLPASYGNGIYMGNRCYNNVISNNSVQGSGGKGIDVSDGIGNIISNNNISSNGEEGIFITATSDEESDANIVSGNIVWSNGGSDTVDGIQFEQRSNVNIVSFNRISDSSGTGNGISWSTSSCNYNYAVGNFIDGAGFAQLINDAGTNTQYTDKVKMTLQQWTISTSSSPYTLDVATNPRSYVSLNPSGNITLILADGKSAGDLLILENVSSFDITINDSGNVNRSTSDNLGQYDILKLIWNGNRWLEMEYVDN